MPELAEVVEVAQTPEVTPALAESSSVPVKEPITLAETTDAKVATAE